MTENEKCEMDIENLLVFRNILQKLQLTMEIHFCKCPNGKQDVLIREVNQFIDAANSILELEINRAAHRKDNIQE